MPTLTLPRAAGRRQGRGSEECSDCLYCIDLFNCFEVWGLETHRRQKTGNELPARADGAEP